MDPIPCATDTVACGTGTVMGELQPHARGLLSSFDPSVELNDNDRISCNWQLALSALRFNPDFALN